LVGAMCMRTPDARGEKEMGESKQKKCRRADVSGAGSGNAVRERRPGAVAGLCVTELPETRGTGKWGRTKKCERVAQVYFGMAMRRCRVQGVGPQNFFSSPALRKWFDWHDDVIDARIFRAEREAYLRSLAESLAYRDRIAASRAWRCL